MINKDLFKNIVANPKIHFGKPVIKGTRVPVDVIVGKIAAGVTVDEVEKEFDLTKEQVLTALKYAS